VIAALGLPGHHSRDTGIYYRHTVRGRPSRSYVPREVSERQRNPAKDFEIPVKQGDTKMWFAQNFQKNRIAIKQERRGSGEAARYLLACV
jgi:hypothetical protein